MYIEVSNVNKSYGSDECRTKVLDSVNIGIEKGSICAILGSSGSGKSTLLNCIGGLDTIDSGSIKIDGKEISGMKSSDLIDYRRDNLGFVFQFYNLIPNLTIEENVKLCQYLSASPNDLEKLLNVLGLSEHKNKFPSQVSGGQQQRCAIARALVKNPAILLCDEPTGALDSKTSKDILILLEEINKKYNTTILIVTHNTAIKAMADQIIVLKDGKATENYMNANKISAAELEAL